MFKSSLVRDSSSVKGFFAGWDVRKKYIKLFRQVLDNYSLALCMAYVCQSLDEALRQESPHIFSLDEKTNLHQICLVQICCKYEICKALQPVQRWQSPNLHKIDANSFFRC